MLSDDGTLYPDEGREGANFFALFPNPASTSSKLQIKSMIFVLSLQLSY
jgi:hypothetical protein